MTMRKRLLSLLLAISMFATMMAGMTFSVFAADSTLDAWSGNAVVSATDGWGYAALTEKVMPDASGMITLKGYLNGATEDLANFGATVALVPQVYVDKVGTAPTESWWGEVPVQIKMRGWGLNDLQWYRGLGGATNSAADSILDEEGAILKDIPVTIYISTNAYEGNYHQIKMEAELADGPYTTNWADMNMNESDIDDDGEVDSLSLVDGVAGFIVYAEGGSMSFSAEPLYASEEEPSDQIESWSGNATGSATDGWSYYELGEKIAPDASGLITFKGYLNAETEDLSNFGGGLQLVPQVYVDKVGAAPTEDWWEQVPVYVKLRGWAANDLQWHRAGGAGDSPDGSILDAEGNLLKDIPVTIYIQTTGSYPQIKMEAELSTGLYDTGWQSYFVPETDLDGDGVVDVYDFSEGVAALLLYGNGGTISVSASPAGFVGSWGDGISIDAVPVTEEAPTNVGDVVVLETPIAADEAGVITFDGWIVGTPDDIASGFYAQLTPLPAAYLEDYTQVQLYAEQYPVQMNLRHFPGGPVGEVQWYRNYGAAGQTSSYYFVSEDGTPIPVHYTMTIDTVNGMIALNVDNGEYAWSQSYQGEFSNALTTFQGTDGIAGIGFLVFGGEATIYDHDPSQGGGQEPEPDEGGYFDDDFEDFDNGNFYIRSSKVPFFHNVAYQLHKALRATTDRTSLNFKLKVDEGATEGYISFIPQDRVLSGGATRMTALKITDTNFEVRNGDDYEDVGVPVVAGQEYLVEFSFDFENFTYSVSIDGDVVAEDFAFNRGVGNDLRADDEGRGFGTDPDNIGIIGICSPMSEGFDMYDISVGIDNLVDNMELKGLVEENNPATNADGTKTYYVGPTRQWQKVQDVLILMQPGDTVEIAGDQTYPAPIHLYSSNGLANGTAEKPITIKGIEVNGKKPEILSAGAYQLVENAADYWVVDGLRIQGHLPRACEIRGLDLETLMSDRINEEWISFRSGYYSGGDNFTMRNCEITGSYQGFQCAAPGNLLFEYNEVWGNGTNPYGHNMYLASRDGAVARIQYNYIHATAVPENNGLKTRAWRNEVYYNYFYNCPQAMELISMENDAVRNSDVVGNVIVSDSTAAIQGFRLGGDGTGPGTQGHYRLANNTFAFLSPEVAYIGRVFMAIDSVEMYNNIFYAAAPGSHLLSDMGANWVHGRQVYGENNFVSDNITVDVPAEFVNTFTGSDPGFMDVDNFDFRLNATSPLIGAGVPFTTLHTWAEGEQLPDPLTVLDKQAVDPFSGELVAEARVEKLLPDLGAFGLELDENYIGAAVSTEAVVDYPTDIVYDVTLSPVSGLNVLALSFKYDPADITFKSIDLGNELLEEFYCELDEETGVINALYVVKEETITTEENEIFATLTFEPTDPEALESYDGSDLEATLELTHFAASGMQADGENSVQYDVAIEVDTATALVRGASRYDVNGDGKIDLADLSMMARHFNSTEAPNCDLVKDGIVDVADLVAMVSVIREVNPNLLP